MHEEAVRLPLPRNEPCRVRQLLLDQSDNSVDRRGEAEWQIPSCSVFSIAAAPHVIEAVPFAFGVQGVPDIAV
jgi:hypothetical protein